MKRVKPLTKAEEPEVVRRAQAGDKAARDLLVTANTGHAYIVAKRYATICCLDVDDLLQYAHEGTLHAIDKFSPSKGVRFLTYATWWMEAYVRRGIWNGEILMHTGSKVAARMTLNAMAPATKQSNLVRLDATHDSLLPDGRENADEGLGRAKLRIEVRARVAEFALRLSPLERDVLDSRILAEDPTPLQKVAERHMRRNSNGKVTESTPPHISRERVRQIEARLRARLKMELAQIHRKAA